MPFNELEYSPGNPPPGDSDTAYIKVNSTSGFIQVRTTSDQRDVVTTDQVQTLTNKTITGIAAGSGTVTDFSIIGAEAGNASLILDADEGDDNADTWTIRSTATGNALDFLNHTTAVASLSSAGALQVTTLSTVMGAEAGNAGLVLDADEGDDNADTWTIQSTASDNELDFINHTTSVAQLTPAGALTLAAGITATGGVLTGPSIVAPSGSASTGVMITKSGVITELTGDGTYTITIPVPAGAFVHRIMMTNQALWTAGTSATGTVGDTADPDGYFTGVNMKGTDLVLGEVLDTVEAAMWGGKEGAYLVAATGQRGPVATNFGTYYAAGSNILFAVVKAGSGTAGRTAVSVTYSVGETIAQVVT